MPEPPGIRAAVFPVVGRLGFADDLEPGFTRHRFERSLPCARLALALALPLYALSGILDRLGALGGSLRVESAPPRGTTVSGAIPAGTEADAG